MTKHPQDPTLTARCLHCAWTATGRPKAVLAAQAEQPRGARVTATVLRCGHATEASPLVLHNPARPGPDGQLWYCPECPFSFKTSTLVRKAPPAPAKRKS